MSEFEVPEDFDKRLQRQLLAMDAEEAQAYAGLVSEVVEKLLLAAKQASRGHEADDRPRQAS